MIPFLKAWLSSRRLCICTAAVCFIILIVAGYLVGPKNLVFVGRSFNAQRYWANMPLYQNGYDGQFYFYIAHNPVDIRYLSHVLDVPGHRYKRILYPLLVWLLTGGNHTLIPWAMYLINAVLYVMILLAFYFILDSYGKVWSGLYYMPLFLPGYLYALKYDLAEPLSLVASLIGFYMYKRKRFMFSAFCFFLSAIAKEQALLIPIGILAYEILSLLRNRNRIKRLVIYTVPFMLFYAWTLVINRLFGYDFFSDRSVFSEHVNVPFKHLSILASVYVTTPLSSDSAVYWGFIAYLFIATFESVRMLTRKISIEGIIFLLLLIFAYSYGENIWNAIAGPESYVRVSLYLSAYAVIFVARYKEIRLMYASTLVFVLTAFHIIQQNDVGMLMSR